MSLDISQLHLNPGGIVVVIAEEDRVPFIARELERMLIPEHLRGMPVLFLQPGEKISSLTGDELAAAGLRRI